MKHNCDMCKCNENLKDDDEQTLQKLKNHRDNIDELIDEFELRIAKKKKAKITEEVTKMLEDSMDELKNMRECSYYAPFESDYQTKINMKKYYPMWFRM